jgi:hypothetical protein
MNKIFIEGKERIFIEAYLDFIKIPSINVELIQLNGWTNLRNADNTFKENSDAGGRNLVVFDADTIANSGGFKIRKNEIEEMRHRLNLTFALFLFPNHEKDGDFEALLEEIVNPSHIGLLDCFSEYEKCISKYNSLGRKIEYKLPIKKSKIYSYVDAFPKTKSENEKFKKGDFFFQNKEMWNLESGYLNPLKEFLLTNIK